MKAVGQVDFERGPLAVGGGGGGGPVAAARLAAALPPVHRRLVIHSEADTAGRVSWASGDTRHHRQQAAEGTSVGTYADGTLSDSGEITPDSDPGI